MIEIAASILAADFSRLGEQVAEVEQAGVHHIHVDVMDGHFVPNLSMGPEVVRSLRPVTKLPIEVHFMVEEPERYIATFVDAGADRLIVHKEVLPDPRPVLDEIHSLGKETGIAVNPDTPPDVIDPFLTEIDELVCMTVYPGAAGQGFLKESGHRIARFRELIDRHNPSCRLAVDGGINMKTSHVARRCGANLLICATAIFRYREGPAAAVRELLKMSEQDPNEMPS